MEQLNLKLFALFNAPANLTPSALLAAKILAKYTIYLIPLSFLVGWFWGDVATRKIILRMVLTVCIALIINIIIGLFWFHPRPFMMGIGHTYLLHRPNTSFPSDHTTIFLACGMSLLVYPAQRTLGLLLIILGVLVGWSRVFLGIHFPLDILGGMGTALLGFAITALLYDVIDNKIFPWINWLYISIFAKPIQRGWVKL